MTCTVLFSWTRPQTLIYLIITQGNPLLFVDMLRETKLYFPYLRKICRNFFVERREGRNDITIAPMPVVLAPKFFCMIRISVHGEWCAEEKWVGGDKVVGGYPLSPFSRVRADSKCSDWDVKFFGFRWRLLRYLLRRLFECAKTMIMKMPCRRMVDTHPLPPMMEDIPHRLNHPVLQRPQSTRIIS